MPAKLLLFFVVLASIEVSAGAPATTPSPEGCDADRLLTADPADDPISEKEMRQARATAKKLDVVLSNASTAADRWSFKVEPLNLVRVERTMVRARSAIDLDGPGFRSLFLIVERYLLNAKGSDGRLRPLAELLKITEGQLRVLVNFLTQMDTLFITGEPNEKWPKFFQAANDPKTLLRGDLGVEVAPYVGTFINEHLAKVLNVRSRFARLSIDDSGNQLTLRSPVGVYKINLRSGVVGRPAIASPIVSVTERWGRQHDATIRAIVDIDIEDKQALAYLRTMLRADAFLHPHLVPPTLDVYPTPVILSKMQEDVVADLLAEDRAAERGLVEKDVEGPVKLAYQVTTGAGKTPIASAYLTDMIHERWGGRYPRIVFVVENTQILNQTAISFHRDLGIPVEDIYLMYGTSPFIEMDTPAGKLRFKAGSNVTPAGGWELVLTTRSTMHDRDEWINAEIEKGNRAAERHPFVLFVDEAHHLEFDDGQFNAVLENIVPRLRREDRIVGSSATFASLQRNIVTEVFDGHIVGNHLFGNEKDQLRRGENLDFLALLQFLRATIDGYINPVDRQSFSLVEGATTKKMLRDRLHKGLIADEQLYSEVGDMIRAMRT